MEKKIYRNTCPRNCFGTCGMLSYVENGKLIKVSGDAQHGFSQGRLCAKGYAYTQYVYSPYRIKHPIMQVPRGSGNWQRISWDKAYEIISNKILDLNQRFGSNLACGYNKFSGNLGLLHYAVEGMFNSIGPHTRPVGNPCMATGEQAVRSSFGQIVSPIPEKMAGASLIVIWGANPAVTNVQQMRYIFQARNHGAKLVVIDPIFTQTAAKADMYIQINPGTDELLALGIAKQMIECGCFDQEFIDRNTTGWDQFQKYVCEEIHLTDVCRETGISSDVIHQIASLYAKCKPCATWVGFGIQRNENGGHSISAINTLAMLTGNLLNPHGGLYYSHPGSDDFPIALLNHRGPKHPEIKSSREIDINDYAENANKLSDPPLKFLWIASRNPFSQDHNLNEWEILFQNLELIVTVDLYMTRTAELSDIVLPAATHFEEDDLNISYWHHWLSINQKAITPFYEAKSDLQITRELTKKLNELSPGFSNFPFELEPLDWIKQELTPTVLDMYSMRSWEDLLIGPHLRKEKIPNLLSGAKKFQLFVPSEKESDMAVLKKKKAKKNKLFPFRLLTPQSLLKIHSQYESLPWLHSEKTETVVEISQEIAIKMEITEGSKVEIFNENGIITARAIINHYLPKKVLLVNQAGKNPVNRLIVHRVKATKSDSSTYFYDSSVNIRKWRDNNE